MCIALHQSVNSFHFFDPQLDDNRVQSRFKLYWQFSSPKNTPLDFFIHFSSACNQNSTTPPETTTLSVICVPLAETAEENASNDKIIRSMHELIKFIL